MLSKLSLQNPANYIQASKRWFLDFWHELYANEYYLTLLNYINPGYGLSLVDTLWNASTYRQPLEQEGNLMT